MLRSCCCERPSGGSALSRGWRQHCLTDASARAFGTLTEIIVARVLAISCGWEDAIDHDLLRQDPALKIAVGRCPETSPALASQSTMTRLEKHAIEMGPSTSLSRPR